MKHDPIPHPSGSHAGDAAGKATPPAPAASFTSSAMLAIAGVRADHARHGHTLEADRAKPLDDMTREISRRATGLREDTQFNMPREIVRRHAVALAALLVALIDRLDADEAAADEWPAL